MQSDESNTRPRGEETRGSKEVGQGARPLSAKPNANTPQVVLFPAGKDPVAVRVEVARTPRERQRGLMFRQHLDPDAGMLFLFEQPQALSFWMRNTHIPLDMIFIEPGMTVLGIVENATPLSDDKRRVPGMSQFVLEVNAGFSRRHGIGPGTSVRFSGVDAQQPRL